MGGPEITTEASSERPLVSIVCLTYNHESFIDEALQGWLAQTYPRLDIVITDDASTDATAALIATRLAELPARSDIRFVRNPRNLGGAGWGNLARGLDLARGEFVVIACGDDVMLPTMVEKMVAVWQRENVSLVTANARYIDAASNELNRFRCRPGENFDDSFETLARDGVNDTCFGAGLGFERSLYQEFGMPPRYLTAVDIMWPFYAYLAKGARFVPEPLLKYRVHPQNSSLSLEAEALPLSERLIAEEHMQLVHLAHAFLMQRELDRLSRADSGRFEARAGVVRPLIDIQITERARKLTQARTALSELGIPRLAPATVKV